MLFSFLHPQYLTKHGPSTFIYHIDGWFNCPWTWYTFPAVLPNLMSCAPLYHYFILCSTSSLIHFYLSFSVDYKLSFVKLESITLDRAVGALKNCLVNSILPELRAPLQIPSSFHAYLLHLNTFDCVCSHRYMHNFSLIFSLLASWCCIEVYLSATSAKN